MAKPWTIEAKGLKEVLNKVKALPEKVAKEVDFIMADEANEAVNRMVNDAPRDMGFLVNGITMERKKVMDYTVSSNADYSIYVEFGTRKFFHNPYPELGPYVSQFKGSGGGKSAKDAILAWAKRVGAKDAMALYWFIIVNGTRPHPFFFRNYYIAVANIIKRVKEELKNVA